MQPGRARNIRDIAHLYISSARSRDGEVVRVVVAGADRECFSGFHVANLASALATQGYRVNLVESSGLLANAACFLALPPQVYAADASRRPTRSVSALDGVEVWFAPPPAGATKDGLQTVELVHSPPLDTPGIVPSCLDTCGEEDVVAFVARRAHDVPREFRAPRRARSLVHLVAVEPVADPAATGPFVVAGVITRWEGALADPLPAAARDPHSKLARDYIECSGRIVSDRNHQWKAHDYPIAGAGASSHRTRRAIDR